MKLIYIIEAKEMNEIDRKKLYKDAIYWHYINQGCSEYLAKTKAEQIMTE